MKKRFVSLLPFAMITVLALSVAFAAWHFAKNQERLLANDGAFAQQMADQQLTLAQLKTEVAALLAANESVAAELRAESEKRIAAEQESRAAQSRLSELALTVEKNTLPKTSEIISQWRPRIAAVYCEWTLKNGTEVAKSGTAVLLSDPLRTTPSAITSKHLLTNAGILPNSCSLDFPGQSGDIAIDKEQLTLSTGKFDWGRMAIVNPPVYVTALANSNSPRCTNAPSIGDGVVILGYPKIGTKADITATEGIISGIDGSYYITSAKVERGNSGGAAILIKENCYLGIPTFVDAGEIESLARILRHEEIDK